MYSVNRYLSLYTLSTGICHYVLCQQVSVIMYSHYVLCQQVSIIMYSVNRYLSLCTLVLCQQVSLYTLSTGICHYVLCQQVTQGGHTRLTWTCARDSLGGWVPTPIIHGILHRHRLLQVKNCVLILMMVTTVVKTIVCTSIQSSCMYLKCFGSVTELPLC